MADPGDIEARECLKRLVSTIEATGGLVQDHRGELVPVADEDWLDLADVYVRACECLGVAPKIRIQEEG